MLTYVRKRKRVPSGASSSGLTELQLRILNDETLREWETFFNVMVKHKGGRNTNMVTTRAIQGLVGRKLLEKVRK